VGFCVDVVVLGFGLGWVLFVIWWFAGCLCLRVLVLEFGFCGVWGFGFRGFVVVWFFSDLLDLCLWCLACGFAFWVWFCVGNLVFCVLGRVGII